MGPLRASTQSGPQNGRSREAANLKQRAVTTYGTNNTGGDLKVIEATLRLQPKWKSQKRHKRSPKSAAKTGDSDAPRPAVGTLTRTKSLLLAALRVWELKQGIRE